MYTQPEGAKKGAKNTQNVPDYLVEDHPTEIPQTAQKLIRQAGCAKGAGMPAE